MSKILKRVLIMAGGTGGHVFPGLAIAEYLRRKAIEVYWLGTREGLETKWVGEAHIPLRFITITGLRGKGIKSQLLAPFKIVKAIWQAYRVIHEVNPDVVIGMGGFVSGPGGIASWLSRYPLIIHEQNAKVGITNKILAVFAKKILEGFPSAFSNRSKVMTVGNPVRAEIESLSPPEIRLYPPRSPFHLLVLGGSLGAKALNEMMPRVLSSLPTNKRPVIFHQTGDKHFEDTKKYYESTGIDVKLVPFVQDMASAYAWADMVLCRAGALTVAELSSAGLGAIFVPFPFAVDDHQTANAEYMVKHHAAIYIQQTDLTAERLSDIVSTFSDKPEKRLAMAKAAYQLRKANVCEKIFNIMCDVVN